MSDLREQVAVALAEALGPMDFDDNTGQFYYPCKDAGTWPVADAALAVAKPIIRAQVIAELANRADAAIMAGVFGRMPLADWLRAQEETAPHE